MSTRYVISVCRGVECAGKRNADAVYDELVRLLAQAGPAEPEGPWEPLGKDMGDGSAEPQRESMDAPLRERVVLQRQSCFGRCRSGPNVHVRERVEAAGEPQFMLAAMPTRRSGKSALYSGVDVGDASDILELHVRGGQIIDRLVFRLVHHPAAAMAPDHAGYDPRLATVDVSSHALSTPDAVPSTGKKLDAGE